MNPNCSKNNGNPENFCPVCVRTSKYIPANVQKFIQSSDVLKKIMQMSLDICKIAKTKMEKEKLISFAVIELNTNFKDCFKDYLQVRTENIKETVEWIKRK